VTDVYYTSESTVYHETQDCPQLGKNGGEVCRGSLSRVALFRDACKSCCDETAGEVVKP
jgi:hypothetical protein